ncbi:MAG: multiheme c-type cytochrome, partial [Phycisphaerae bacterium]
MWIQVAITVVILALMLMPVCSYVIDRLRSPASGSASYGARPLPMVLLVIGMLAALSWSVTSSARSFSSGEVVQNRPIEVLADGYAGSDSCRSCHPGEYGSWHASFHRTMTQVASDESVLAPFDDVTLTLRGRTYQLSERDGEFWVTMDQEGTAPGSRPQVDRRIVMTTGSHHLQVYWFETGEGRRVAQLPFSFLVEEDRWIPDHASFIRPPWPEHAPMPVAGPARWEKGCIRCHATQGRPRLSVAGLQTVDTHVSEFGISCESCHGPSAAHVEANRDPRRRYGLHFSSDSDKTVSHPTHMTKELSSQVCGQCHSVHTDRSVAANLDWQNNGSRFEPGCDLFLDRHVVRGYADEDHPTTQR